MNLVTNASEAIGDRDGVIRVATRRVTLGQADVIVSGLAQGEYVKLEVSDTGSGMAPETKARMFDPFFTTKAAGRGLGLAVVQGIVRSLDGSIHVTSEPGRGTTFRIWLPSAEKMAENIRGPRSEVRELVHVRPGFTVLVVEDEGLLRQAVARMLRKAGFEALEASDGSAAVDVLRMSDVHIDLILLDLTLPGASSKEVISEAARTRPELKVVLTSAYSEEIATATLNSSLIKRFIRKPFQLVHLVQMLRSVLSS